MAEVGPHFEHLFLRAVAEQGHQVALELGPGRRDLVLRQPGRKRRHTSHTYGPHTVC